jgi:hypothetical protein
MLGNSFSFLLVIVICFHMSEVILFLFGCVKHLTGDRGDYIANARHKYFFNDSDAPSFRLLEDEDDNGKPIEEPELYRPIGMDDCSYNKQIEVSCLPICLCYHFFSQLVFSFCLFTGLRC